MGKPTTTRTPGLEEAVLQQTEEKLDVASVTRTIANYLGTTNNTVWRVLSEQLLRSHHVLLVQALFSVTGYPSHRNFLQWFLDMSANNRNFPNIVLFTGETRFRRHDIVNSN